MKKFILILFIFGGCSTYNPTSFKKSKKRCVRGVYKYCSLAGDMLFKRGDYLNAKRIYKFACSKNNYYNCSLIGKVEEKLQKIENAKVYYKLGCDNNDGHGCYHLARLSFHRQTKRYAKVLLKKSCRLKFRLACQNIKSGRYNFATP